ncbi:MAG TPA: glycosyltransferase [Xanthobacteraceae bacterium]|nr:glycosyltransferase [Xanthobacteraceae bacterium]
MNLNIVIFGLSITSSWGNGHATTYRALVKALAARGHQVTFLERDTPWYRDHRDLLDPPYCRLELYRALNEVPVRFSEIVADADLVVLGSYVPQGAALADWITTRTRGVTAFYDIDTPVTLSQLESGKSDYISPGMIPRFDLYLSFTGGPVLELIEEMYGSPRARALYCAVDPEIHMPVATTPKWELGYIGTYSADRQPSLDRLLIEPARRLPDRTFVVAGPQYPGSIAWPDNVQRLEHLPPGDHSSFYSNQRYTLNVTRSDMIAAGFSPSVRLFEAAACGVPIVSDRWPGLDTLLVPDQEILIVDVAEQVVNVLLEVPEARRLDLAAAARKRVLQNHTANHRAAQLEAYYQEVLDDGLSQARIEAVA